MNSDDYNGNRMVRPPVFRETDLLLMCLGCGAVLILIYIATARWHFSIGQIQEIAAYCLLTLGFAYVLLWHLLTQSRRIQEKWPPLSVARTRDRKNVEAAWKKDAVVLGYDALGNPWLWPDQIRVMQ